jgi:hypothetical protein
MSLAPLNKFIMVRYLIMQQLGHSRSKVPYLGYEMGVYSGQDWQDYYDLCALPHGPYWKAHGPSQP